MALSVSHQPPPPGKPVDASLRGFLASNSDIVTRIIKPVHMADIGALSAQSDQPIVFENIVEKPGFRLCDILVKTRRAQARALGTTPENYLRTLAYRLRQPPRGLKPVKSGPVKEVVKLHNEADWTELPIPFHKDKDSAPYVTAMNIIRDPETGFYNSCHAGTHAVGPRRGLISFVTPHSHVIMGKYREMGRDEMPIAFVFGVPPAYEIMANFSGLHMDAWGEMEMVGTIMDRDIEMVPCETLEINVPAEAEIVVEGHVNLKEKFKVGDVTSPSMYNLPHYENLPEVEITAITMRGDRPIYRNHQTCPDTDHQPLPRLCHEAVLYNRLSEIGLAVKDVRFPTWGAALSCIIPLLAIMNDGYVQHLRVAATAALGMKYLSREDSHVLGIYGSGGMAKFFPLTAKVARPIERIQVYSPNRQRLEAYLELMKPKVNCEIVLMDNAQKVAQGADILASCTTSMEPVTQPDWIRPGMHLNSVTPWEFSPEVCAKIDAAGILVRRTPPSAKGLIDDGFGMKLHVLSWIAGTPEERAKVPTGPLSENRYVDARYSRLLRLDDRPNLFQGPSAR
jgi:2,5-furandicarboxylate decarboxylase 1